MEKFFLMNCALKILKLLFQIFGEIYTAKVATFQNSRPPDSDIPFILIAYYACLKRYKLTKQK